MLTNSHLDNVYNLCAELQTRINIFQECVLSDDSSRYPKESGAIRRTSMELTRALADLRRSYD